jgi:hypothetical protein
LEKTIADILAIISDYHNYRGFQFTAVHILSWVNQFKEEDREFLLQELLHLLQQGIYISEEKGRTMLVAKIENLSQRFGFTHPVSFLANTEFLRLQPAGKSQDILLRLLNEELTKKYGLGLAQCGAASKKYAVYVDDVLATGGTVFKDSLRWLETTQIDGETNLAKVLKNEKFFIISVFCRHTWANVIWRLKMQLKNDAILKKIQLVSDYEIQNHPTFPNQRLNFAYPTAQQPQSVLDYLNGLEQASNHEKAAFRPDSAPTPETLFSSAENRIRFENILLHTGIQLLGKAATLKPNHRPLGATFPSYKTFGTGTLFFTWRNIPNTSPIAFWWEAGGWRPFFPLFGRGLGGTTFGT